MANANFDSTAITNKAISLIVAIIVFACVLVPVVGSMADGGGNPVIYNSGLNYTKADSGNHILNVEIVENEFVVTVDEQIVDIGMEYDPNVQDSDMVYPRVPLAFGYGEVNTGINSGTYFTILVLAQNGVLNYILFDGQYTEGSVNATNTITISNGVGNWGDNVSFAVEYYIVPEGEYVMTTNAKILDDTEIMIAYPDPNLIIADSEEGEVDLGYPAIYGRGTIATLDSTVETNLTQMMSTVGALIDYSVSHTLTTQDFYSILNNVSITFTAEGPGSDSNPMEFTKTINADTFLVPKIISEGSGGDSGSGSDITSTLIQIIPVFVALGLILAIVGMFYNSKMD